MTVGQNYVGRYTEKTELTPAGAEAAVGRTKPLRECCEDDKARGKEGSGRNNRGSDSIGQGQRVRSERCVRRAYCAVNALPFM